MEDPRRPPDGRADAEPPPDTTTAAAFAPPPGSARSIRLFLATVVLVICLVTGSLIFFTDLWPGYGVALLAGAVLAGAAVVMDVRRRSARRR